jgi:NAD(P)H dehydrogenase (quinone)
MTTLITGATGNLGALTVNHLLDTVPATELVVSVRDPAKAAAMAERGVRVRQGDFERPETVNFAASTSCCSSPSTARTSCGRQGRSTH